MKKPWAGRFTEETSKTVEHFTESVSFDRRLWKHDIEGSIAHARMLGRQGIIPKRDAGKIVKGLKEIGREIEAGLFEFTEDLEDIHMNIEAALIRRIGDAGAKLHTARSRNDQVALDLRLYLRSEIREIGDLLRGLEGALVKVAERHIGAVMPGYTHLQRAQPVLLSHHLMAYAQMLDRDRARFRDALKRVDVLPLGSCALSGTSLSIDRQYVGKLLAFPAISENSMDAVSDRDFALEFLSCSAILMMHLSRFAEEIILWSTEEFSFVELPDHFTTGSSIMPQKKNPDVAELIRGKTGRIYGSLMGLLTTMKGLPLTYNRDMQEDKEPVFDTVDTIKSTVAVLTEMVPQMKFDKKRLSDTADAAYATATDIAEYLVRKGTPFRVAHEVTGRVVRYCLDHGKKLSEMALSEYKSFSKVIGRDVYEVIGTAESVASKKSSGGTSPAMVKAQIGEFKKRLANG